ncbi:hypothetical protein JVU11DRAFT_11419 [Chiua virens]|nr:hypothetical protein JVU11DRAFT_11419 [Chiua virens]
MSKHGQVPRMTAPGGPELRSLYLAVLLLSLGHLFLLPDGPTSAVTIHPSRFPLFTVSPQYRLCNPPPAVGKVRSCGVTPILNVRLDDVLTRRHLPPIGLKDLEEYLLYVEHAPENLYFVLWLKDYTARYNAWAQREKTSLVSKKEKMITKMQHQKFSLPPTPDPALAMFYLRAKQTFFTPNGEYELNIPSDVLAPFHTSPHAHVQAWRTHGQDQKPVWASQSIHPDPAVFTEVSVEVRNMLSESLRRFVRAAYTNVGSQRAVCGIMGGCFFTVVAGLVPLVLTTGRWNMGSHTRWIRWTAFPGLWLGLTVLIASLQGICLMVYVFGDLRQLRKFELSRLAISRPMQAPTSAPVRSAHHAQTLSALSETTSVLSSPASTTFDSPTSQYAYAPHYPYAQVSASQVETYCDSCASEGHGMVPRNDIDVSPALWDDVPAPEGPATASCLYRPEYRTPPSSIAYMEPVHVRTESRSTRPSISTSATGSAPIADPKLTARSPRSSTRSASEFGPTAGFIPNDYNGSTSSLTDMARSLRSQRSACYFDFDSLPTNLPGHRRDGTGVESAPVPFPTQTVRPATSTSSLDKGVGPLFGRMQYKCNQQRSPAFESASPLEKGASGSSPAKRTSRVRITLTTLIPSFTRGVPAFAAPLTQVQSPVVKRAQWEVVVRAGFLAAVIATAFTGLLVGAVP